MIDNETLTVAGIPITVTRKQRQKNLYIRINPPEGDVTVSAPADATEDAIRYYVLRKVPEITKIRDRMVAQPRQSKREYVSGEACYLWGKPYMLQVIYEGKRYRIEKTPQRIIMHAPEGASEDNREKALTEWYRGELKRVLPQIIKQCEEEALRIVKMMPRWIPGKQCGVPVRVKYAVPFRFNQPKPKYPREERNLQKFLENTFKTPQKVADAGINGEIHASIIPS